MMKFHKWAEVVSKIYEEAGSDGSISSPDLSDKTGIQLISVYTLCSQAEKAGLLVNNGKGRNHYSLTQDGIYVGRRLFEVLSFFENRREKNK